MKTKPKKESARAKRFALGLAVASLHAKAGIPMEQWQIAAFCGVSKNAIQQIERSAIMKLRKRLAEMESFAGLSVASVTSC